MVRAGQQQGKPITPGNQGTITPGIREPSHLGIRDVAALVAQVWQPVSAAREALAVVSVPLAVQCARRALLAQP